MRSLTFAVLLIFVAFAGFVSLKALTPDLPAVPTVSIAVLTTPTTVALNGPVILDAVHSQARLETVSMSFALDQDLSKTWGLEGVCQESITYLAYFNVTAGIDLQQIGAGDVIVENGLTPAQTAITIYLPPAAITHVELDTQRSRVVHNQVSVISQFCGTHLPDMVLEAQTNLQKQAEAAALDKNIVLMAQERAGFALQKLLVNLGFTRVTVQPRPVVPQPQVSP